LFSATDSFTPFPKLLRRDSQGPIEFAGGVFPGNYGRKFDYLVVVIKGPQLCIQLVVYIAVTQRDAVCKLERNTFGIVVELTGGVFMERIDFFIRNSKSTAHGSIDVLSKLTAVKKGNAPVYQRIQPRIDASRSVDARPHAASTSKNGWSPGVHKMVK
jgi:hypothetical protein